MHERENPFVEGAGLVRDIIGINIGANADDLREKAKTAAMLAIVVNVYMGASAIVAVTEAVKGVRALGRRLNADLEAFVSVPDFDDHDLLYQASQDTDKNLAPWKLRDMTREVQAEEGMIDYHPQARVSTDSTHDVLRDLGPDDYRPLPR